jgi:hypothetical protein
MRERIEGRVLKRIEPLESRELDIRTRKAVKGSRRLRNAVWKLQGYQPPKPTKATLCPACLGPIAPRMLIAEIQQTVGAFFGFHRDHILGDRRDRELTRARQIAMYLSTELTGHSLSEIGRRFTRDHTTVMHAVRMVHERTESDEETALNVALLRERLGA